MYVCTKWLLVRHLTRTQSDYPHSSGRVRVRVGLRLGLGESLFPVGVGKDQRLPAGPIATVVIVCDGSTRLYASRLAEGCLNKPQVVCVGLG